MRGIAIVGAIVGGTLALAGCAQPAELSVDGGWVRLGAVTGRPAAAYFTVHGGPAPATLITVTTDVARRSEMHESMSGDRMTGGMASMKPIASVAVPANGEVVFAPGGRHVMLFDVNPGIKPGARMTFTYTFSDGRRIVTLSNVIGAGDPGPE